MTTDALLARIKLVLTAFVFWLGIAGAIVTVVLASLGDQVDNELVAAIVGWLAPASTVIFTLTLIIRRVSEVIPQHRGLLPIEAPILMGTPPD